MKDATHEHIARAFSRHRFHDAYPALTDETLWEIVGGTLHHGRESIIRGCDALTEQLRSQRTVFTKFDVLVGQDFAVVHSRVTYVSADNTRSTVALCDMYRFSGPLLREIVSFAVELTPG